MIVLKMYVKALEAVEVTVMTKFLTFCILFLLVSTASGGILEDVETLCQQNRLSGTAGCVAAEKYIASRLGDVEYQQVGRYGKNIIQVTPGSDDVIVLCAHYDSIGPGADDNASGVATVLNLDIKRPETVIKILFVGEEQGLHGSRHYVKNPVRPLKNHKLVVNFDMVGHLKRQPMTSILYRAGNQGTDSDPFYAKGVPILFVHTGLHEHYHRSTDLPNTLDYYGLSIIQGYDYLKVDLKTLEEYKGTR